MPTILSPSSSLSVVMKPYYTLAQRGSRVRWGGIIGCWGANVTFRSISSPAQTATNGEKSKGFQNCRFVLCSPTLVQATFLVHGCGLRWPFLHQDRHPSGEALGHHFQMSYHSMCPPGFTWHWCIPHDTPLLHFLPRKPILGSVRQEDKFQREDAELQGTY